jgi:hypothetical protein
MKEAIIMVVVRDQAVSSVEPYAGEMAAVIGPEDETRPRIYLIYVSLSVLLVPAHLSLTNVLLSSYPSIRTMVKFF